MEQSDVWTDLMEISSPLLAPWRLIADTEFCHSDNFMITENRISGVELEKVGADSKSLFGGGAHQPNEAFEAALREMFIIDELSDPEAADFQSTFLRLYYELSQNIDHGCFEAKKMLCYDEEFLISLKFSPMKIDFILSENEDFDLGDEE